MGCYDLDRLRVLRRVHRDVGVDGVEEEAVGVTVLPSTMPDGMTPICNSCGITLCWDIPQWEATERAWFWENWECRECRQPRGNHGSALEAGIETIQWG